MLQYAIRYFVIVSVVPPLFVAAFAITVGAAAVRLASDPTAGVEALTPVLLLQLFVASSGFRLPARRGHFDLLLTSGAARWQIAMAHCLVSVAPGIASWFCVGMLELVASHGDRSTAFASGTCVAFVGASVGAWGAAVHASRMAAAIAWLLVMAIPAVARVVSPVRLLGMEATGSATVGVAVTIAAASLLFSAALWSITRGAAPLEAAQ
jgi:hypothetical protein